MDGTLAIYKIKEKKWSTFSVNEEVDALVLLKDGFLVGGSSLSKYDNEGNLVWEVDINSDEGKPAIHEGKVYLPSPDDPVAGEGTLYVLSLKDGRQLNKVRFKENVWRTVACDNLLALGGAHHVYLFKIHGIYLKEVWRVSDVSTSYSVPFAYGARDLAFDDRCDYLVFIDTNDEKLVMVNGRGERVFEKSTSGKPKSVAFANNSLIVGLDDGSLLSYLTYDLNEMIGVGGVKKGREVLSEDSLKELYEVVLDSNDFTKLIAMMKLVGTTLGPTRGKLKRSE